MGATSVFTTSMLTATWLELIWWGGVFPGSHPERESRARSHHPLGEHVKSTRWQEFQALAAPSDEVYHCLKSQHKKQLMASLGLWLGDRFLENP